MTHMFRALALISTVFLAAPAMAADVTVSDAWARASAKMAKAGAAFMTIKNAGHNADKLVAAKADVSEKVELHTHIREGDIMRMRQVPAIDVPAMGDVELKPGGLHVMFLGLHAPLKEGATFPLTLTFEKAGTVTIDVTVKTVGAMGMGHMDHGKMKHEKMDHGKMDHGKMKH